MTSPRRRGDARRRKGAAGKVAAKRKYAKPPRRPVDVEDAAIGGAREKGSRLPRTELEAERDRALVEQLTTQGYSLRGIAAEFARRGRPLSYETIRTDRKAVTREWVAAQVETRNEYLGVLVRRLEAICQDAFRQLEESAGGERVIRQVRKPRLGRNGIPMLDANGREITDLVRETIEISTARLGAAAARESIRRTARDIATLMGVQFRDDGEDVPTSELAARIARLLPGDAISDYRPPPEVVASAETLPAPSADETEDRAPGSEAKGEEA